MDRLGFMTVQDIISVTLKTTEYRIESHWDSNVTYQLSEEVLSRKVMMLLVRDDTLIISI